eukprot:scaffold4874_cov74-Phaeocystis_antarctica.AAC.1
MFESTQCEGRALKLSNRYALAACGLNSNPVCLLRAIEDAKVAVCLPIDVARVLRALDHEAWSRLRDRRRRLVLLATCGAAVGEVGGD